jgi:PKD repeat protein
VVAQRLQPDGTKVDASPVVVMSASFGPARVAALGHDFLVVGRKVGFSPQYVFPVAARVRGTDGAVLDATPLVLGNSYLRTSPQVVALGDRWLVAWHRNATHDDSFALTQGAFVNPDGTATAEFTIHGPFSTAGGNGSFEVGLASNGNVALMVQSQELTSGVETDLLARFIQADGTVSPMTNLTPWSGNQYKPRVAWDGTNFIVAYHEQRNRNAPWTLDQLDARSDLFGMRITPTGSIVDPQGFVFSSLPTGETDPTVTALNGVTLIAGSRMVNDTTFANYRVMYEQLGRNNNQWPVGVVTASATSGDVPLVVNFNSLGSTDPDGSIASYLWDFGDGVTSTLADPNHIFTTPGEYLVSLTLTDNGGAQTTQAVLVNATAPNQLPVAVASADKTSGKAPLAVVFSSKGSYDPDGFVGNIQWQFSDGGQYWGSTAYHTFTTVGSHTATLTVFDSRGATSSTSLTIDVVGINQPPVAVAEATPTSGNVPLVVQFDSSGSFDPDGTITSYFWNFGDAFGTTSTEPNPSYTYNYAGTYTAQLTVTDDNNVSSSSNVTITVAPAPLPLLRSYDIALSANVKRNRATVSGTVTVVDENFRTVQGAAVTIAWLRPDGSLVTQSATTDRRGKAKFSTTSGLGTYTLTVKDILLTGYAFDTVNGVLSSSITA